MPALQTAYSTNGDYKVLLSPRFCNEEICLEEYFFDGIPENMDSSFYRQEIIIYKKRNTQFEKLKTYIIPIDSFYFSASDYYVDIANDGNTVLIADNYKLFWCIIKLSIDKIKIESIEGVSVFDLNPNEYARVVSELSPRFFYENPKAYSKIKLSNKSFKIKLRYYNEQKGKYITIKKQFLLK